MNGPVGENAISPKKSALPRRTASGSTCPSSWSDGFSSLRPRPSWAADAEPAAWADSLKLPGHIEARITGNFDNPRTYGELTLGVNYKPEVSKAIEGFVIRPELRFDGALNGTKPFSAGTSDHHVTLGADFVLPF